MAAISVDELKTAVERLHGCKATFLEALPVSESFQGRLVWEGVVHVFDLTGHSEAKRAYAWSEPVSGSARRQFFAVLHVPPVDSALAAVKTTIVDRHRRTMPKFDETAMSRALRNLPWRKDRE
jgi:hypothetical protein